MWNLQFFGFWVIWVFFEFFDFFDFLGFVGFLGGGLEILAGGSGAVLGVFSRV